MSKGCPVCNTLKMITSILRVMAMPFEISSVLKDDRIFYPEMSFLIELPTRMPQRAFVEDICSRRGGNDLSSMFVLGTTMNRLDKFGRVTLSCDNGFNHFTQRYIVPLIGYLVAKTDIAPLQLVVHLLLKPNVAFG